MNYIALLINAKKRSTTFKLFKKIILYLVLFLLIIIYLIFSLISNVSQAYSLNESTQQVAQSYYHDSNSEIKMIDEVSDWSAKFYINTNCLESLDSPTLTGKINSNTGYRNVPYGTKAFNISKNTGKQINLGTDYYGKTGDPAFSRANATVVWAGLGTLSGSGYSITIKYNRGSMTCYIDYNHLSKINVSLGQNVKAGQVIGAIGATGNATGSHLDLPHRFKIDNSVYNFIDLTKSLSKKIENRRPLVTLNSEIKLEDEVLLPIQQAINNKIINKNIGAMILMLHPIESYGSGNWKAKGVDTGNGRYAVGLTQIMNYPEFNDANKRAGTNYSIEEYLNNPDKQIQVIKGLMNLKIGNITNEYNQVQALELAKKWLGFGCDIHGTCTNVYAQVATLNYNIAYYDYLYD